MSAWKENIGEGIAMLGIMIAIGLTKNYWLLFLIILPFLTSGMIDSKIRDKYNDYVWRKNELELDIKKEELRLLKARKR